MNFGRKNKIQYSYSSDVRRCSIETYTNESVGFFLTSHTLYFKIV